jgi:crotonobetainyl-CoA:carnitine CoA-transferase CaiB-like acyl-CoA transferase
VDVSYVDGVISLMTPDISYYLMNGQVPRRGETFTTGAPLGNVHKCKEGEYIPLGCTEPRLWANVCRAIGEENLISR